eukprot:CAMPEP_0117470658 /NCGR_PEP_ID=MMETSP0784-20121206/7328_1 /TAXON_ID=39447 /ORGANISM="" /LENGTH=652 /DNA_ID=CAMNT_0005264751 /DNA_START=81 /DNA_END=2039 /DNA_ORIENTATION=+
MCKFHILGMCAKGDDCHFAHVRDDLQLLPDLYRTKLCKTLINTGICNDPSCRYAHNKDELRIVPGFNISMAAANSIGNGDPLRAIEGGCASTGSSAGDGGAAAVPEAAAASARPATGGFSAAPGQPKSRKSQAQGSFANSALQGPNLGMIVAPVNQATNFVPTMPADGNVQANQTPQPLMLSAMTGIGGMWQPILSYPQIAPAMLPTASPEAFDQIRNSFVNHATMMQQMGQAAQVHAAEALRLQAMASCLQANSVNFEGDCDSMPASQEGACHSTDLFALQPSRDATDAGTGATCGPTNQNTRPRLTRSQMRRLNKTCAPERAGFQQCSKGPEMMAFEPSGDDNADSNMVVKNTFLNVPQDNSAKNSSLRAVMTCGARLDTLVAASQSDNDGGDAHHHPDALSQTACTQEVADGMEEPLEKRFPQQPVQINLSSLRSLSSQSLTALDPYAESDEAPPPATPPMHPERHLDDHLNLRVKNTFLDFESPYTPAGLRPISSASGRLDALMVDSGRSSPALAASSGMAPSYGGMERVPEDKGMFRRQETCESRASDLETEKRLQDTPFLADQHDVDGRELLAEGDGHSSDALAGASGDAKSRLLRDRHLLPEMSGLHVKNTFLDFSVEEQPKATLRAVHTAAGRLDMMGDIEAEE